jgi:hypothetical protein
MSLSKPIDHTVFHNPGYVGGGIWFVFHSEAADAKTLEAQLAVIALIRRRQRKFPCLVCKEHFGQYLEKYPPEEALKGGEMDLFYWTVDFHNTVNGFTGKGQVSREDAYKLFVEEENLFCTASCGKSPSETKPAAPPPAAAHGHGNFRPLRR